MQVFIYICINVRNFSKLCLKFIISNNKKNIIIIKKRQKIFKVVRKKINRKETEK